MKGVRPVKVDVKAVGIAEASVAIAVINGVVVGAVVIVIAARANRVPTADLLVRGSRNRLKGPRAVRSLAISRRLSRRVKPGPRKAVGPVRVVSALRRQGVEPPEMETATLVAVMRTEGRGLQARSCRNRFPFRSKPSVGK